ncbi:hypothetical protein [Luteibacter rhizovicinus]|uniref:hypothetical protein n=1 Tax=Luteibacter rhizovicinus TaxID=242606 RepID=UPI001051B510|nr:hypothetical protein [Luteibacter rhizovicinus]
MVIDPVVSSADLDRFWKAYDAAVKLEDPVQQEAVIQKLYIDPGTNALHAFMQGRGYNAHLYMEAIRAYPRFWATIRPRTLLAGSTIATLKPQLLKLRTLYPEMRQASINFEIGTFKSGGTTQDDMVLIGTELAMGDSSVDVSEMPERMRAWIKPYFDSNPSDTMDVLLIHEFVHTQQSVRGKTLLQRAMQEGVADFVAELVTGRKSGSKYVEYGMKHDATIKPAFREVMNGESYGPWLYSGVDNEYGTADLGYYIGSEICRAYYNRSPNKQAAIKQLIELEFANAESVKDFVRSSRYFD